ALALLTVSPASAGLQDFTLQNRTGYEIYYVYVSPKRSNQWGNDVLGESQTLPTGYDVEIYVNGYADNVCAFDIKAVDEDEDVYITTANLCTQTNVEININHLQQ
ncbi:MAG: hypothetical protein KDK34_01510, partial [Leptospiraceae bacterium]|nr:hypothetical protein [Leptospiraceae bacterium]